MSKGKRIFHPDPRAMQVRHLQAKFGISKRHAELIALHNYGAVKHG
jgi:hypothetical protein